ncbi:hypothetical protein LNP16_05780 [Apilactobacillus kunkeei]|uniref:hypothetical protein n=1 Tax=Apilactobacillus kunkeei TaxID=148814 RepID=UPI00200A375F|nr:hypothetical protein [Apilactobacillus kunkeei]MCK8634552.1 hypothetical protein [Apilactobacillus kunkeei]CAI2615002.1 hypothetical protein AKUH1B104J_08920 [Apilactobacillus kunkeei]
MISNQVSKMNMVLNRKIYLYAYILFLIFLIMILLDYQRYSYGKMFLSNWILYALNKELFINLTMPIIFITLISFMMSYDGDFLVAIRIKRRINMFWHNCLLTLYNAGIVFGFIVIMISVLSVGNHFSFDWNKGSRQAFLMLTGQGTPYKDAPLLQIGLSLIMIFLSLIFWGLFAQLINLSFKRKSLAIFINVFIIVFQQKASSIPGLGQSILKYVPCNHTTLYAAQVNNFTSNGLTYAVTFNLIYWLIAILLVGYGLYIRQKNREFV